MSYIMKTNLSRRENYGPKRNTSNIQYIVIHYTANDGDHDESNANYFHNRVVEASAHYFVDDDSITMSVPDHYIAWSVGGPKWNDCSKTGGGKLYEKVNNNNSISIEMCDTRPDGHIMATEETITNTIEFCKTLMDKYNIDVDHVIRHFDVNGKHCPAYYMDDNAWAGFKNRLATNTRTVTFTSNEENNNSTNAFEPYKVSVEINNLNIRKGPGTNYGANGVTGKGVFTIVDESSGEGSDTGWGKLKSGAGWISLDFAKKI